MIELIEQHAATYPHQCVKVRLEQIGLTERSYRGLCKRSDKQTVRESAIPETDLTEAINFFVAHPDVGAGKARATLIAQGKAWISVASLNQIKHELTAGTALDYKKREEEKKLLEAQLRKDLAARKKDAYVHLKATYPHHIWAIDFVNIIFMDIHFVICAIYDEYSQEYPAIKVGVAGDQHLAAEAFQEALVQTSTKPVLLRRDNGKAFETELFQKELETTKDYPIPPHSPWFNGGLESCNGTLKAAVKTTGMQKMVIEPTFYRQVRRDSNLVLEALGDIISDVRIMLNQDIARLRHGMTPAQVISGEEEARAEQEAFVNQKRAERKERMAEIRKKPDRKPKNLITKTKTLVKRAIKNLETDALYVLNEVLHHRFRMFET